VTANNQTFNFTFGPRVLDDGSSVGLNKGLIGFGSNNSRGVLDNVSVSTVSQGSTLDVTDYFEDGTPDQPSGPAAGTWTESNGRYVGSAAANGYAVRTSDYNASIQPNSSVTVEATLSTTGIGGVAFDTYASNDFKFAALDVAGQRVVVGHVDPRRGWVVQTSFATALTAGTDYVLNVVLKDTVATVSLNGNVLGSFMFNAAVADGQVGVVTRGGTTSADRFQFKTDDSAFVGTPPPPAEIRVGNASASEGDAGTTAVTVTLSLTAPVSSATTVSWITVNGTATAGSDFVSASGTATFAAGSSTATLTVLVNGDTTYEPTETFQIKLTSWAGFNLAGPVGTVTIVNDELAISVGNATVTEGDNGNTTVNVPVTLTRTPTTTVTVVVTTVAGTATAGSDFVAKTQTLTFNAGTTTLTQNFQVSIVNNKVKESTETFTVKLSNATGGATIETGTGTVTIDDNDGAMLAAAPAPAGTSPEPLTAAALAPVVSRAESMWLGVLPNADFSSYSISIGSLSGLQLGWTDGQRTTIDATAAGWGWAQMDLLTVVLHELGRALGFTTDDAGRYPVMAATLAPGERLALVHRDAAVADALASLGTTPKPAVRLIGPTAPAWITSAQRLALVTSSLGKRHVHITRRTR
jgi:hypothetical protein